MLPFKAHHFLRFSLLACLFVMLTGGILPASGASGPFVVIDTGGGWDGSPHTCGILTDGTLRCWGDNVWGQSTPPAGDFSQVSVGRYHACGLRRDNNRMVCWGRDTWGQSTPPSGTFQHVSAGASHTCAIRNDGTITCWGYNAVNNITVAPAGHFIQVSAGTGFSCAVSGEAGATSGPVKCWGDNEWGMASPLAGSFRSVVTGGDHACGIRADGTVACWGKDWYGQVKGPSGTLLQVAPGQDHTCGLYADRSVSCWGLNDRKQAAPPAGTFAQIYAEEAHTCALTLDGTGTCWGEEGPFPPIDFHVLAASDTQVQLTWVDASSDETEFRVERAPYGTDEWMEIGTSTENSYTDSSVTPGTNYSYRARTYRASDKAFSVYSDVDSVLENQLFLTQVQAQVQR